ncbi:TolC family protein [Stakelama pacifica]|uniref:Cobalt-zinc-cadmium efflux system outer membrane protein n=1 Tax=Stakelama pacifica TaxID=517720 RepID=A0A4R6FTZ8_9SPHN|nr:TolC family protein [Stakelama pacifica]TDN85329.1 cobalt-zinc-cadmium efflux system outer membrane protein [Stakelama pacifica]
MKNSMQGAAARLAITVGMAAIVQATPASAQSLTFGQAVERAEGDAPSVEARSEQATAARRSAVAADQLPDPTIDLDFNDFRLTQAPPVTPNGYVRQTIGVRQEFPNLKKRHARADRAAADITAADAREAVAVREARLGAALAWVDLYFAQKRLDILAKLESDIGDLQKTMGARLASGSATGAEAFDPDILAAKLADRRSEREAAISKARAELRRWTGIAAPQVAGPPPATEIDSTALAARIDTLPKLRVRDAAIGQAQADVRLARAEKHPDWALKASFAHRQPQFGNFVSIGVSIDLPLFAGKRQDPVIDARLGDEQAARLERIDAERQARAALSTDLADYRMRREQYDRARDQLVPLSKKRAVVAQESYAAGRLDLGAALNQTIALADAEIDLLEREAALKRAAVQILFAYTGDAK